ncbi:hypothetical protein OY671_012165, partial [Metschnikowia pulcherrima]
ETPSAGGDRCCAHRAPNDGRAAAGLVGRQMVAASPSPHALIDGMMPASSSSRGTSKIAPSNSAQPSTSAAEAKLISGADQGVYIETSDGKSLLAQQAQKPVHPASVSKVPTTLASLRKLGPDYRFVTTFSARAPVANGTS